MPDLSRRLERALDLATQSRIDGVAALPGNPLGVELRQFDGLTATIVRHPTHYYGYYTSVRGIHDAEPEAIPEALAWFQEEGFTPRLITSPALTDEQLLTTLHESGLRVIGYMSLLYGQPRRGLPEGEVAVAEAPAGNRRAFEDLWLTDIAESQQQFLRRICRGEFSRWQVYVGLAADGETGTPAAYGCLHCADGVGVMASGWTHPAARGQGLQTTLLQRRIHDAAVAGCDLVLSTAVPGSQSEGNLQRAGLTSGYTQTIWST